MAGRDRLPAGGRRFAVWIWTFLSGQLSVQSCRPKLYPGGVRTTATVQLFTDYLTRLMRYVEFMKRVVPMHHDLFDFFYEAMPGTGRSAGAARTWCAGAHSTPPRSATSCRPHDRLGRTMFVSPGVIRDGRAPP